MSVVAANGLGFHVQELGDVGAGTPLVMLHGLLLGSLASWYFTAAPVLARARRVRLFDLRGHGRSELAATGYDLRTMAGDLAALTADLPGPIDLAGHSWGGLVALRFALAHPERVRRLAIVEGPLPPSRGAELTAFSGAIDPGAPADPALPGRLLEALPAAVRELVASGRRQAERLVRSIYTLTTQTSLLADLRAEPDFDTAELATLDRPVLCAYGDRSACLDGGRRLAAALPDARLTILPGGHYLHLEAKDALIAALDAHFAEPAHG